MMDDKEDIKKFNRQVLVGLIGGLFVVLSQLATAEFINILKLPDHYIVKMVLSAGFAFFIFVVFALTMFFQFRK